MRHTNHVNAQTTVESVMQAGEQPALQWMIPSLTGVPLLVEPNSGSMTHGRTDDRSNDSFPRSPGRETEIVLRPTMPVTRISSVVLQKWEGVVIEIGQQTLVARLTTLVGSEGDQIAEIYLDEIDAEDRTLLAPGAVFYWSIGYREKPSGRERFSQIRLRRLPMWSASELRLAEQRADALGELLNGSLVQ